MKSGSCNSFRVNGTLSPSVEIAFRVCIVDSHSGSGSSIIDPLRDDDGRGCGFVFLIRDSSSSEHSLIS